MIKTSHMLALWAAAAGAAIILGCANLHFGDLNQDEGWYLYTARLVAHGQLPYRDFAFTQGPVMPYAYAAAEPLVRRFGVAGGRLFTAALGLATAAGGAWLAARTADRRRRGLAGFVAFSLLAVNVYQSYYTTVVKTYALSGLLLVAGLLFLSGAKGRRRGVMTFLSGVMLALAAGTRVSGGAVAAVAFLCLWLERRQRPLDWWWLACGGGLTCVAMFGPFVWLAPDSLFFGLIQYHANRSSGGLAPLLIYKAGFVSRLAQAYFLAAGLWVVTMLARSLRLGPPADSEPNDGASRLHLRILWGGAAAVTLAHLAAPMPYEDYQVMVFPLFAAALAVAISRFAADVRTATWIAVGVLLLSVGGSFSSPLNQDWFVQGRDRIWWRLRTETPLQKLAAAARVARELAGPGNLLLTQDTYLAVEAGMDVPAGLELGPFSYYPAWNNEECLRRHVVNKAMMMELIAKLHAPVAALSGYSLSIRSPEVVELPGDEREELWRAVRDRYGERAEFSHFGQGSTTLLVLARKPGA